MPRTSNNSGGNGGNRGGGSNRGGNGSNRGGGSNRRGGNRYQPYPQSGAALPLRLQKEQAIKEAAQKAEKEWDENHKLSQSAAAQAEGANSGPQTHNEGASSGPQIRTEGANPGPQNPRPSTNRPQPRRNPPPGPKKERFGYTTEAERHEIVDTLGRTAVRLVDKAIFGGNSDNYMCKFPQQEIQGVISTEEQLLQMFRDCKRSSGIDQLVIGMRPVDHDMWNTVNASKVHESVIPSSGRTRYGTSEALSRLSLASRVTRPANQTNCLFCKSTEHGMENCLGAPKGDLPFCFLCCTQDHTLDACGKFTNMSLTAKVEYLVVGRTNKPALRTKVQWFEWLHTYCCSDEFDGTILTGFPWSKAHARFINKDNEGKTLVDLQKAYDDACKAGEVYELPEDPATATLDKIDSVYWSGKPNGLSRPSVLGVREEAMDDAQEEAAAGASGSIDQALDNIIEVAANTPSARLQPQDDEEYGGDEDKVDFSA
ncbi:hypothetical protein FNAPI_9698 [Fusarium napiforme]|uniref:Uncharacterized protein n=1 Tax=Fusarium napiforme TaxID=42672 RepID=A0A8H5IZ35_9HYPO|nr:hypothetical protein FNAPI_9698 [Fusarium napiforme]